MKMKWYELIENPQMIVELYHEVPLLQSIDLMEVVLSVDHAKMILRADLPRFPDNPPTHWKEMRYSTIQIQLEFFELQSLKIIQWSTENLVDAQIERTPDGLIRLNIISSQCDIRASAPTLRIASVSAYKQGTF
jgi:Immunity protein 50